MQHKLLITVVLFLSFLLAKPALAENPRKVCVTIKTSAECEFCKANIEKSLSKVKGVRKVKVDYVKHEIYLTYNSKKITVEKIRTELNEMGYDADGQKANFDKFKKQEHEKK